MPPSAAEPSTSNQFSRLFTQAELELLPNSHPLDRKTLKKAAKRSAKAAREAEIREREADADMFDAASMFGSMSVAVPKRPEKKKAKTKPTQVKTTRGTLPPVTIDAETQKELDFANFLNSVGGKHIRKIFARCGFDTNGWAGLCLNPQRRKRIWIYRRCLTVG